MSLRLTIVTAWATLLLGGCTFSERDNDADQDAAGTDGQPAQTAQPAPPPPDLRLEVSLGARELRVYRGGQVVERHPVAVGSSEWPTPTGEWSISQVIFNPRWVPPPEAWAADEEPKEPGDPENPLGKAQLVYNPPNSIHGTNAPESLGKAVSHGSIRVANDVAVRLARAVMEAGGARREEAFFTRAQQDSMTRQEIVVPNPVPIRVLE